MNVTPLTARIGVEVSGLDLRGGLSESQRRALRDVWLRREFRTVGSRLVRGPCA